MPLLPPRNKLDYNNDGVVFASKITATRARQRMSDPLRNPEDDVIASIKRSKNVNDAMASFRLLFENLKGALRSFQNDAVIGVERGLFREAIVGDGDDFFEEEHQSSARRLKGKRDVIPEPQESSSSFPPNYLDLRRDPLTGETVFGEGRSGRGRVTNAVRDALWRSITGFAKNVVSSQKQQSRQSHPHSVRGRGRGKMSGGAFEDWEEEEGDFIGLLAEAYDKKSVEGTTLESVLQSRRGMKGVAPRDIQIIKQNIEQGVPISKTIINSVFFGKVDKPERTDTLRQFGFIPTMGRQVKPKDLPGPPQPVSRSGEESQERYTEELHNAPIIDGEADALSEERQAEFGKKNPQQYYTPVRQSTELSLPIGQTLLNSLSRIVQLIQRIDDLVVNSIRPYLNDLSESQLKWLSDSSDYLEQALTANEFQSPSALIDIFKGMKKVSSFSSGLIDTFITEVEKLRFDLMVVLKSYKQNYPQVKDTVLFRPEWADVVEPVEEDLPQDREDNEDDENVPDLENIEEDEEEIEGMGRSGGSHYADERRAYHQFSTSGFRPLGEPSSPLGRLHGGNGLRNYYGNRMGRGTGVPSIYDGKMRSCPTKYLL